MTVEDIVDMIIQELAGILGKGEAEVRQELLNAGTSMPFDSIVLAEVLVAIEGRLGRQLPDDQGTARALRSVTSLAKRFHDVIEAAT